MKRTINRTLFGLIFTILSINLSLGQSEHASIETEEVAKLGSYSISLNVADINTSLEFYQHLGFTPIEGKGSVEQKWVILSNGDSRIGLFQGFFPSNSITFNPTDGRSAYKAVTENEITPAFEMGMDQKSGPCTFSIVDPDGNAILIDQH